MNNRCRSDNTNLLKIQAKKAWMVFVIERTLYEFGGSNTVRLVNVELARKYECNICDCCENPQYLAEILKQMFGQSYNKIILTINEKLEEFSYQESIRRFLENLTD